MPRKNNRAKHIPFVAPDNDANKRRFPTKRHANDAAEYQMLLKPDLELYVYKSNLDGGWYLTRKKPVVDSWDY